jgi:hypothetical protein
MDAHVTIVAVAFTGLLTAGDLAHAVTPEDECEAARLAAMGQRISTKLHCRAWAKAVGTDVPGACIEAAENQFLELLQSVGPECADPGLLVDLGAEADSIMADAVEIAAILPSAAIPDVSGVWVTRTALGANPAGADPLICGGPGEPPCPDVFVIIECRSELAQTDRVLHQRSECHTTPDSPEQLPLILEQASGPVDPTTGEFSISGSVEVTSLFVVDYKNEGAFSDDGNSVRSVATAGQNGQWLWLAVTSGERVQE